DRCLFIGTYPTFGIVVPMEFFLYAINRVLFVPFIALPVCAVALAPTILFLALIGGLVVILVPSLRSMAVTYATNNLIMLAAWLQEARGNKQLTWEKIEENRLGQRGTRTGGSGVGSESTDYRFKLWISSMSPMHTL